MSSEQITPMWRSFLFSAFCNKVEGEELTCMACGEAPATGHARLEGGPFDGRVVLLLCPHCSSPEGKDIVTEALYSHFKRGWFDIVTGGPGPMGGPEVWHKTHWDPMSHDEEV